MRKCFVIRLEWQLLLVLPAGAPVPAGSRVHWDSLYSAKTYCLYLLVQKSGLWNSEWIWIRSGLSGVYTWCMNVHVCTCIKKMKTKYVTLFQKTYNTYNKDKDTKCSCKWMYQQYFLFCNFILKTGYKYFFFYFESTHRSGLKRQKLCSPGSFF